LGSPSSAVLTIIDTVPETELLNGVALNDSITGTSSQGSWKYYYVDLESGETNLVIDLYGLSGDVDLYVKAGDKPTLSVYDCRPYKGGTTSEQCNFSTPSSGRWWIGVNNYVVGTISYTIRASWDGGIPSPTNLNATAVSRTQINLTWQDNSSDESDFHIERSPNGSTSWTEIGTVGVNVTSYSSTGLSCGTPYYYRVRAHRDGDGQYSDYTNVANATTQACNDDIPLSNGVPLNNSITGTSQRGSWKYYYVDLESGETNLVIDLYGLSGDVDLYVKSGTKPTLSVYDCRPYKGGTTSEQCNFSTPSSGRWWIGVNNWELGTISYTIKASWSGVGFADVPSTYWAYSYIMAIYNADITTGCSQNPLSYCPEDYVTREQMAAFIVRAVEGEPPVNYCDSGAPFLDIAPGTWSCRYIKRLYELGITTGYQDGSYRPYDLVSREQMAAFIVRAVEGEPPEDYCALGIPFPDVASSMWSCDYIKRLKELSITTGYGDGTYGPYDLVSRAQMAAFLARAFLGM
jgi:hypothetical protein